MTIPSFEKEWVGNERTKPRIQILEIRHRERSGDAPIAWLVAERQEAYQYDDDGGVYKASIRLSYERIMPRYVHRGHGKGCFCGSYSRLQNAVSLTSDSMGFGAVFLDLPGLDGHRIGTYLLNEIVTWVKRWPEASVQAVALLSGQAENEESKERRNWFYEQFGLVFDYADPEHREGRSRPMLAKELTPVKTWQENITERYMLDYLADVLYAEERASLELKFRTKAVQECVTERNRAEAKPIRWALKTLYYQNAGIVGVGVVLSVFAAALWLRFWA